MHILYWNTCLTTKPKPLFKHLMLLHHVKNIDYFCLNEATAELVALFKQAGWYTFYVANTAQRGVLIASRHVLKNSRSYLLSSVVRKKAINENHILIVEANWKNKPLIIATTHLTYLRPKEMKRRAAEREVLTKVLPRNRTVFGGDLNTVVFPLAKWDIQQLGFKSLIKGKTWCWHLKNSLYRIPIKLQLDHVFTNQSLYQTVSATILREQKLSDHFPILVKLH